MCAAWRCGGLVFRLCCRMVFRLRRFLPFLRLFSLPGFVVRASVFFVLCVAFCCCGQMLSRLMLFWLFAVRYFCRNHGRILRRQTAAVAKGCFSGFPKGRLLACKRWSFAARKDTFCTLKGHLLESGFSAPRALPHGSRRGRAEPCLGRGTLRA